MTDENKPITIIRAKHGEPDPYFRMARALAQNRDISFAARGVMTYLLSRYDHWQLQPKDLQQKCGKNKAYNLINELIDAGYIVRWKAWNTKTKRIDHFCYEIYEHAIDPEGDLLPQKLDTGKLDTGIGDIIYKRVVKKREDKEKDLSPQKQGGDKPIMEAIIKQCANCKAQSVTCTLRDNGQIAICSKCGHDAYGGDGDRGITENAAMKNLIAENAAHETDGDSDDIPNSIRCGYRDANGELLYCHNCYGEDICGAPDGDIQLTVEQWQVLHRAKNDNLITGDSFYFSFKNEVYDLRDTGYIIEPKQDSLLVSWQLTDAGRSALETNRAQQKPTMTELAKEILVPTPEDYLYSLPISGKAIIATLQAIQAGKSAVNSDAYEECKDRELIVHGEITSGGYDLLEECSEAQQSKDCSGAEQSDCHAGITQDQSSMDSKTLETPLNDQADKMLAIKDGREKKRKRSAKQLANDAMIEAIVAATPNLDRDKIVGGGWQPYRDTAKWLLLRDAIPDDMRDFVPFVIAESKHSGWAYSVRCLTGKDRFARFSGQRKAQQATAEVTESKPLDPATGIVTFGDK